MALHAAGVATILAASLLLLAVVISCTDFASGISGLLPLRISCGQFYSELHRLVSSDKLRPEVSPPSVHDDHRQHTGNPRGIFDLEEDLSPRSDLERAYSEHAAMNDGWHSHHQNEPGASAGRDKRRQQEGSLLRKVRLATAASRTDSFNDEVSDSLWPRFLLSTDPTPPSSSSSASSSSSSSPSTPPSPPGPQCKGKCCSNAAPDIPAGMPRMTSSWISNQLAHGAQIQIRSKVWGTWWTASDWSKVGARVRGHVSTQPNATQFLQVVRLSNYVTKKLFTVPWLKWRDANITLYLHFRNRLCPPPNKCIQFQTPAGTYLGEGLNSKFLEITENPSSKRTVFVVSYAKTNTTSAVPTFFTFFKCLASGLFITEDGNKGPQLYSSVAQEWELHDVREVMEVPAIRGANLGGWLWYEYWMNPVVSFQHFIDGTRFTLFSPSTNMYVNAPGGGGTQLTADLSVSDGQSNITHHFYLTTVQGAPAGTRLVSTQLLQYWTLVSGSNSVFVRSMVPAGPASQFTFTLKDTPMSPDATPSFSSLLTLIQAPNGKLLQANPDGSLTADFTGSSSDLDIWTSRAAFNLSVVWEANNMYQAAMSLGSQSSSFFQSLWSNFITEADWQNMQALGINAVRIPIPYWLSQDPSPPYPLPSQASSFLDWAFAMANKYGIRVWFSMHMAAGGQSGKGNCPDGSIRTDFDRTLQTVQWLASRYGSDPAWLGMGLLNEPGGPGYSGLVGVELSAMQAYYSKAHDVIRRACACCFVSMEARLGYSQWDVLYHLLDTWHPNMWYESHLYNCFSSSYDATTVEREISEEYTKAPADIADLQKVGRPLLVGEFCNAMGSSPVTAAQQANFSLAQMQAVGGAQAGWFFWSYKMNVTEVPHWQFVKSAANGWLPKKPDGNWY